MRGCSILSTRPELIKCSRILAALDSTIEHTIIHSGQNWAPELRDVFFSELEIRTPDYSLKTAGNTAIETTANIMTQLESLLIELKPQFVFLLGDTNGVLAAAYVAKRLHIPIFHAEAGNRCFTDETPEEINRRLVDQLSDYNLPYSHIARENLLHDGLPSNHIITTGSPMMEVLTHYSPQIDASHVLTDLDLVPRDFFVVSCHREENTTPEKFKALCDLVNALADKYHRRVVVSAHPRVVSRLTTWGSFRNEVEIYRPWGFFDYCKLQKNSQCTLSDSGTLSEESSILGFPALMLRTSHERPECDEEGGVIMVGMEIQRVVDSLEVSKKFVRTPAAYAVPNVSEKVVKIILSHVK